MDGKVGTGFQFDLHANFESIACMKQVTIRKVKESSISKAKERAREHGVAMNTVLVEALEKGLGEDSPATNGLEQFAGDSDFGPDWDSRMEELGKVNPEDWK
jgi:hypothetical protein